MEGEDLVWQVSHLDGPTHSTLQWWNIKEACATLVTLLESCNLVEHQWHYPKSSRTCPNFDCNHRRTCSYLQPAIDARISLLILATNSFDSHPFIATSLKGILNAGQTKMSHG